MAAADLPRREGSVSSSDSSSQESEVRKVHTRKRGRDLTKDQVYRFFDRPADEAALALGIGQTYLKKWCRSQGIKRWPFRKTRSLVKLKNKLGEEACDQPDQEILEEVEGALHKVMANPDAELSDALRKKRQSIHKREFVQRSREWVVKIRGSTAECQQATQSTFTVTVEQQKEEYREGSCHRSRGEGKKDGGSVSNSKGNVDEDEIEGVMEKAGVVCDTSSKGSERSASEARASSLRGRGREMASISLKNAQQGAREGMMRR